MSCASCTANIEKVLNKTNGVISASANFPLEKAVVEFYFSFEYPAACCGVFE